MLFLFFFLCSAPGFGFLLISLGLFSSASAYSSNIQYSLIEPVDLRPSSCQLNGVRPLPCFPLPVWLPLEPPSALILALHVLSRSLGSICLGYSSVSFSSNCLVLCSFYHLAPVLAPELAPELPLPLPCRVSCPRIQSLASTRFRQQFCTTPN